MTDLDLQSFVRDVPDFPKPGILFKDITTLLLDPRAYARAIDLLSETVRALSVDAVACVEARGFLLGAPVAARLGTGVIPIRKPGKLPAKSIRETYALEYGTDSLEIHEGAIRAGERVVVLDDVLATGGTAAASGRLVTRAGGALAGYVFLIELGFLGGRAALGDAPVRAVIVYD